MYALGLASVATGDGITCPGQINPIHWGTTTAAKEGAHQVNLPSARTVRYWLDNARPGRAPQSYVGLAR
jgi:hypothetical protein